MKSISENRVDVRTLGKFIQSWDMCSLGVLTGNAEIYQLAHVWIAVLMTRGYRVHVIDCAIRFNVYRIIQEANLQGVDIQNFLDEGLIRRAFTPYQILDVCREILVSPHSPYDLYFILAPSKQFFDGDVKDTEGHFLLRKLVSVLDKMQIKRIPFLAVESNKYKHKTFQFFFQDLLKLANATWQYNAFSLGRETVRRFEVTYKNTIFGPSRYGLEIGGNNGKNGYALFQGD